MKSRIVVVGCGIMGRDIAAIFCANRWQVTIVDRNQSEWQSKAANIARSVEQLGTSLMPGDLTFAGDLRRINFNGVRVVIESVSERLTLKQEIARELDLLVPKGVPIGSNSSGFRISDIAKGCTGAPRMANTHFFLPAHIVPLVEIARGEETTAETCSELREIFAEVGRVPVVVQRDLPGLLANRMQHALMREAFWLIDQELATAEDVNDAVRFGFGFRYVAAGPILQKEFAGLDTQCIAAGAIYPSLCNDDAPARVLRDLVNAGKYGVKSGEGFRRWTNEDAARAKASYEAILIAASKLLTEE